MTNVLEQITCPQLISPTQSSEEEIAIARELHADAASEAFVTIVESIAFPSATQNNNDESKNGESLGEELVLKSLGEQEVVSRLVCAATLKGSADSANCDHQVSASVALY